MQARVWWALGLMVVTGCLVAWPVERSPPLLGEEEARTRSFLAQHAEIEAALDGSDYREADRGLRALLAEEDLREEVIRAGDRVRTSVVRCAFGLSYRRPDIGGLFGVESASWNRRSRRLQVVFDRDSSRHAEAPTGLAEKASVYGFHPRGFTLVDGVYLFDVPFAGPCQIAVSGRLPEHKNDRKRPPQLVLIVDEQLSYTADFTWPTTYRKSVGLWSQGTIYEWDSGVSRLLATDPTPGGKYDMMWGARYELKLVAKSTALAASLQGYGMLSVRKARRVYGRLGFRWCPSIDRLSVSGIVQPEVVESLYDVHREQAYAAFSDPMAVGELLPVWLREVDGS